MEKIKLTHEEKSSKLWKKIRQHVTERISLLRNQNDADSNEIDTAKIRGRIAEAKGLLELEKEIVITVQ